MPQKLIILRGVSGSGKTTLAEKLRDSVGNMAWVQVDKFKSCFPGYPQDESEVVLEAGFILLEFFLDKNYSVVTDSIFRDLSWVDKCKESADRRGIDFYVFDLFVELKEMVRRDRSRAGVVEGWRSPIKKKYFRYGNKHFKGNTYPGAHFVDTTNLSLDEVLKEIKNITGL